LNLIVDFTLCFALDNIAIQLFCLPYPVILLSSLSFHRYQDLLVDGKLLEVGALMRVFYLCIDARDFIYIERGGEIC
jgi:hypothetical protein